MQRKKACNSSEFNGFASFCLCLSVKDGIIPQFADVGNLFCLSFGRGSRRYPINSGVQHLLHLKSKSKILRPIEIMGFFYEFFCQI